MTKFHPLELAMKAELDGTFRAVNRNSGEYTDKIVDYGFVPDYTDEYLGVPRPPKKPSKPKKKRPRGIEAPATKDTADE